jgi:asparagine synthase (glutamine-hydrolysing)
VPGLGDPDRPLVDRLLDRVERMGPEGLGDLNGIVVACLWDERSETATLANDRLGIGRLHYRVQGGRLAIASRARTLAHGDELDAAALGHLLEVGYPLEDRTLYRGVRLLPPASLATWHSGQLLIRRVWEPPEPAAGEVDIDEAAERLATALGRAVERALDPRLFTVLPLSGGLDSRALLGMVRGEPNLIAASYGHRHSWDLRFGSRLARAAGCRHRSIRLDRNYMARFGARGVYLADGEIPIHAVHILSLNPLIASRPSIVLSGYLGDALTGAHLAWMRPEDEGDPGAARRLFERHYQVGFTEQELRQLLRRPFRGEAEGAAYEAFLATYRKGSGSLGAADRVDLELRQRRFIAYQMATLGAAGLVRAPFADHEVIDAALALPTAARRDQGAYRRFITISFPDLARVPLTATGIPLAGPALLLAFRRQIEWCRRHGLPRLTRGYLRPHDYRQYAHYDEWIRNGSRGFFADLIDDRALLGDILDVERVADLFKAHLEGRIDAYGRLSAVATLAMWKRQAARSAGTEPLDQAAG